MTERRPSIDPRVEKRDTSSPARDVVVRLQMIALEKSPAANYRWALHDDGRWYLARHSGDTSDSQQPFDTELPDEATRDLDPGVVREILERLRSARFDQQPEVQVDDSVEGGQAVIVTARLDGELHEVIYHAVEPEPVPYLLSLVDAWS